MLVSLPYSLLLQRPVHAAKGWLFEVERTPFPKDIANFIETCPDI
jgi:hypothetical protein